jgi:hypothetical protein
VKGRPDIVAVIGQRVELRRARKEMVGLCPFHSETHPSFFVSIEKQVFLCRGCQAGGDVVTFIMLLDGLTFPDACRALGIDRKGKLRPKLTASRKHAADLAAKWANGQRAKLNSLITERMEQRDIADEAGAFDLAEIFDRELSMLHGLYDALQYARGAAELLTVRASIEQITDVEIINAPPPSFPALTPDYLDVLKKKFEGYY